MEVIIVAIIVSLVSPTILAIITSIQRRSEKRDDWEREDLVAAKALIAAKLVADTLKKSTKETNNKLDTIHTLVNSNMTAAMQSELNANMAQLVLMREVIELKGIPSQEALDAIVSMENKVKELKAALEDRLQ